MHIESAIRRRCRGRGAVPGPPQEAHRHPRSARWSRLPPGGGGCQPPFPGDVQTTPRRYRMWRRPHIPEVTANSDSGRRPPLCVASPAKEAIGGARLSGVHLTERLPAGAQTRVLRAGDGGADPAAGSEQLGRDRRNVVAPPHCCPATAAVVGATCAGRGVGAGHGTNVGPTWDRDQAGQARPDVARATWRAHGDPGLRCR